MSNASITPNNPSTAGKTIRSRFTSADALIFPTLLVTATVVGAPKIAAAARFVKSIPWSRGRSIAELSYPPLQELNIQQLRPTSAEVTTMGATLLLSVGLAKMKMESFSGRVIRYGAGALVASVGTLTLLSYVPARIATVGALTVLPGYFACMYLSGQIDTYVITKLRQRWERYKQKAEKERPKREARRLANQVRALAKVNRMRVRFGLPPITTL